MPRPPVRHVAPLPPPRLHRGVAGALATLAGVALLGLGCGTGDPSRPVQAGPPPGERLIFQREGVPGPWWRDGATQEMFDAEHRVCLARSQEARTDASGANPADAAYRAFLECMRQRSWSRSLPPRSST
jgi:hypothetical protein